MKYIYLHGFASSINSVKAKFFKDKFTKHGSELVLIDLNTDDFTNVTVNKMIKIVAEEINKQDVCIIGSSLGGLISLILAEENYNVKKLVLMAPALEINSLWDKIIGSENFVDWRNNQEFRFLHSGLNQEVILNYNFIKDLLKIKDRAFVKLVPTLIFHGFNDQTIPIEVSERYNNTNLQSTLHKLDSDHSLENSLDFIWDNTREFLFDGEFYVN